VNRVSLIGLVTAPPAGEVVRIEVHSRADVAALPAHTILTDIDKARWNANGKVEFSSDLFRAREYRAR
jgi:hypothetical protein